MVESQPSKLLVAGSIPVSRSSFNEEFARNEGKMFEQAAIAVIDQQGYSRLQGLIDAAFDLRQVEVLLDRVVRAKLPIRDFEQVLERGLLGKEAIGLYGSLAPSDQGLTREHYLRLVEKVPRELRERYFRAYAYY